MSKLKTTIILPVLEKQKKKSKPESTFALLIDVRKTDEIPKIKGLIVRESNGEKSLRPFPLNNAHSLCELGTMPHTLNWILYSFTQYKLHSEKSLLQNEADIKNIFGTDKEKFVKQGLLKTQYEAFE